MKEKRIEFETAKLANSKGFDIETYELDYMVDGNYPGKQGACVSCTTYIKCSTQTLLQKWLREVHNIAVIPCFNDNVAEEYYYFIHTNTIKAYSNRICSLPNKFNNYEEALEIGLFEALKLINDAR